MPLKFRYRRRILIGPKTWVGRAAVYGKGAGEVQSNRAAEPLMKDRSARQALFERGRRCLAATERLPATQGMGSPAKRRAPPGALTEPRLGAQHGIAVL